MEELAGISRAEKEMFKKRCEQRHNLIRVSQEVETGKSRKKGESDMAGCSSS